MVFCGSTTGTEAHLDVRLMYIFQQSVIGCYMGGKREFIEVLRQVEAGRLRPVVDRCFALADAALAQQRMLDRKNLGKIVLTV